MALIKPSTCHGCPLETRSFGFLRPAGSGSLGVFICGEAGGKNEALLGEGFVKWADAGSVLNKAIERAGYVREQFVFGNIAMCQPPDNKFENVWYEQKAAQHCKVHMDQLVRDYKPRVILALGNTALKHLTGMTGRHRTVSSLRGYVLPSTRYPGMLVVPSFHPSYLRRGAMKLFRILVQDIGRAVDVAQGKDTNYDLEPRPPRGFNLHPSIEDARSYLRMVQENPQLRLAYDIETAHNVDVDESEIMWVDEEEGEEEKDVDEVLFNLARGASNITQVQFSTKVGDAICFPWRGDFRAIGRDILRTSNPKIGHNNWRFDDVVLGREGIRVLGRRADTMWAWHNYQPDLPAHLQFVASHFGQPFPWKHFMGSDFEFYGACDVDVLHRIWDRLPPAMGAKTDGLPYSVNNFDNYHNHVERINAIVERISQRGIPVNDEERIAFGKDLDGMKEDYYDQLNNIYPHALRKAEPPSGFVRIPAEVAEATEAWFPALGGSFTHEGTVYALREFQVEESVYEEYQEECKCKKKCKQCGGSRVVTKRRKTGATTPTLVERWCRLRDFAPSYQQVADYIIDKKHKMPRRVGAKKEERNKASTGKL